MYEIRNFSYKSPYKNYENNYGDQEIPESLRKINIKI